MITDAFASRDLNSNEDFIDVGDIIAVLVHIFESAGKSKTNNGKEILNVSECVDMTLNWLLNVYDRCVWLISLDNFKIFRFLSSRLFFEILRLRRASHLVTVERVNLTGVFTWNRMGNVWGVFLK